MKRKFTVGPKSICGSSAWDLGWSKRSNDEDGTYFVVSCPSASAVVKQSKTGTWVAYIDFRDGNNRHSVGMKDEFDAMDWAQKIIHNYATNTVASTGVCASDDEDYTFQGKKYRFACDTREGWETAVSDNPLEVLDLWFKWSAKYPMEAAITTRTRADGVALLKAAQEHLDELYNKYDSPYKYDYLVEAVDKKIADNCSGLIEDNFGDQIYPFCYG